MIYLRIICLLFLIVSAVLFPLPITLFAFAVMLSFLSKFWEGVLVAIFLDSLYFSPTIFSKFNIGFFTISFIVLIVLVGRFKSLIHSKNLVSRLALTFFSIVILSVFLICFHV